MGHADAFRAAFPDARLMLFTTKASISFHQAAFERDDILLFGQESAGVPPQVASAAALRLRIPLRPEVRSFNLATAAAIGLTEALRQTGELPR